MSVWRAYPFLDRLRERRLLFGRDALAYLGLGLRRRLALGRRGPLEGLEALGHGAKDKWIQKSAAFFSAKSLSTHPRSCSTCSRQDWSE